MTDYPPLDELAAQEAELVLARFTHQHALATRPRPAGTARR